MGGQPQYVDDQRLGCFPSLIHICALLLGRLSISIRADWYGLWRHSRPGRLGGDALGKPTARTLLYPEPLARIDYHFGDRRTFRLRLVARYALRQQRSWRSALADCRLWHAAVPGSRCRFNWLLSGLLRRSAPAHRTPRATAIQLNELRTRKALMCGRHKSESRSQETKKNESGKQESRNGICEMEGKVAT